MSSGFAQLVYTSNNNYTGDWETSTSWTKQAAWMADPPPGTSLSSGQITNIYGYITRNGDLSLVDGVYVNVYDTLVIEGNLSVNNQGFVIHPGGLLIVLGDFTSTTSGGAKIENNGGKVVTVGEFTHWEGTITNTGDFYVYDDTPFIDGGTSYPSNTKTEQQMATGDPVLEDFMESLGVGCGFSNSINSNQWICSGSTAATITGATTMPATPASTYLWESSTTSATAGFTNATGTNNTASYSPGARTVTTWFRRRVTRSGCPNTSPAVKVTIMSSGGWTGASSSNWNTNTNWCNNTIPSSTIDAIIPVVASNRYPSIGSAAAARDLIINPGASVTISSNTLSVHRDFTFSGALTGSGTLAFVGNVQQTVSGNALTVENLTINNATANQVRFTRPVSVRSTLTLTAGIVNIPSGLTLGYNQDNRGSLVYTAGRFINGTFTRWLRTWALGETDNDNSSNGNRAYFFPMGTTSDTRPLHIWTTTASNPAGTISVSHTGVGTTTTGYSINDPDAANRIIRRENSSWTVATGNGLSGGTFGIKAGGTGFGTVTNMNHIHLMRPADVTGIGTSGTATGSFTDFLARRTGLSATGIQNTFHIGSTDNTSPLPIKLVSFTAQREEDGVLIKWATSMEKDVDYFQLERAGDDLIFTTIASEEPRGGLETLTSYSFLDQSMRQGRNYYRLKSIDIDGTFEYSNVIQVSSKTARETSVYPTQVTDYFTVDLNDSFATPVRLTITSSTGAMLYETTITESSSRVELPSNVTRGVYLVKLFATTGQKTFRIVVK